MNSENRADSMFREDIYSFMNKHLDHWKQFCSAHQEL